MKLNKKLLLILIILNLIGVFAAWYTYNEDVSLLILTNKFYLVPLVPVSFILYFLTTISLLFIYSNNHIPKFLTIITFYLNFVYGLGASIFYLTYMYFLGFSFVYTWYIIAHLFLGIIALCLLNYVSSLKIKHYLILSFIAVIKDYSDINLKTTSYLDYLTAVQKSIAIALIVIFQLVALFLLYNHSKKHLLRQIK